MLLLQVQIVPENQLQFQCDLGVTYAKNLMQLGSEEKSVELLTKTA